MRIVKLPSGYRQVEYIQSAGTQYIDTGYAPSGENMRVVFDFMYTADHGSATLYGTQKGTSNLQFSITAYSRPMFYVGTSQALLVQSTSLNTRYVLDAHANSGTLSVSLNGATQTAAYSGSLEKTLSLSLFGNNINGATSQFVSAKAYSCQIYDNNVLVRDFIPCKNPSNIAGMYDLVEGKFYGDAAGGYFISGVPLVLPKGYRRLTYIQSSGTQYIDTGFKPNQDTTLEMKCQASGSNPITAVDTSWGKVGFGILPTYGYYGNSLVSASFTSTTPIVIKQEKNLFYKDGVLTATATVSTFQCAYNLILFGLNRSGTAREFTTSCKLYYYRIFDNGTLVRDFVPCINSAGEVGLYDDVNGAFYGNAGTGTFTAGQRVYAEDEIVKLEYVESNGTQYVDTGVIPNQNTGVTMDFEVTDTSVTSWLFAGRTAASNAAYGVYAYTGGARFYFVYGTEQTYFAGTTTTRQICTANKNQCTIGNNTVTITAQTFTSTATLCLLARNTGGTVAGYASAKLYSCQIYDNGAIARDYYPATADGVIGLWDAISGVLYENAGSGNFVAGPVIYEGLPAPGNLAAEVTETGVILRWEAVETALGYRVYRDYLFLTETAETEYTDSDTQNWEQYTYSVRAFNEEEEGTAASVVVILTSNDPILDLITDRTAADVNRVLELSQKDFETEMTYEEQREFLGSMKGAYNASDLNRVGAVLMYIANRLNAQGTAVKISPKTDWMENDIPTPEQLADYLAEISAVRGALAVMRSTPTVPNDMENFTYDEANNIEQILLDVDLLITNMSLAWFYCGEVYSGEV